MLEPGALLQSRYRVVKLLSKGGMGSVYEAIDERLHCTVALKETLFAQAPLRRQFEREAHILARLRHPAMTKVMDHFDENGGQFLVMEFIGGSDLHAQLKEGRQPFEIVDVLAWGEQLLDALEYLHSQNPPIIHRDIKPQNLKLAERNQIILLDFGLAKDSLLPLTEGTTSASLFGYTPHYAPLEQIEGKGTDARSDLYSLAASLYELLTAQPPADAVSRASALARGENDPLIAPELLRPELPIGISAVLGGAMSLGRERRPPTARAMRDALRSAAASTRSAAPTLLHTLPADTRVEPPRPAAVVAAMAAPATLIEAPVEPKRNRTALLAALASGIAVVAILLFLKFRNSEPPVAAVPPSTTIEVSPIEPASTSVAATTAAVAVAESSVAGSPLGTAPAGSILSSHTSAVNAVEYSPDGSLLASGSDDGTLILWDAATMKARDSIPLGGAISGLAFAPDGKSIVAGITYSAADNASLAVIVDLTSRAITEKTKSEAGLVSAVSWHRDGKRVAFADGGRLRIWSVAERRDLHVLEGHESVIQTIAFSPTGDEVASGGHDGRVLVWSTATGKRLREFRERNGIRAVAFTPDGSRLAWGNYEDFLFLGDPSTGSRSAKVTLPAMVNALAFSPDGTMLAVAPNITGRIMVLRVGDLSVVEHWDDGDAVSVSSLVFSPDSTRLLANSGHQVKVWQLKR